jgi:hypothetical protein
VPETSSSPPSFIANVRRGVRTGIAVAIGYSLVATVLAIAAGGNPFEEAHMTFWAGIALYFAVGLCLGTLGGLLTPLMGSAFGLALAGLLLGAVADFSLQFAMKGLSTLRHYDWGETAFFAAVGLPAAFYLRSRIRARAPRKDDSEYRGRQE